MTLMPQVPLKESHTFRCLTLMKSWMSRSDDSHRSVHAFQRLNWLSCQINPNL